MILKKNLKTIPEFLPIMIKGIAENQKKFDVMIIFGILHLNLNWDRILLNASKVSKSDIIF